MKKYKCTYDLNALKVAFSSIDNFGRKTTNSAFRGAQGLGFSREDMLAVIQSLSKKNFYKSMTSFVNHRIWQDVYNVKYQGKEIYLKFTMREDGEYILISFKEK